MQNSLFYSSCGFKNNQSEVSERVRIITVCVHLLCLKDKWKFTHKLNCVLEIVYVYNESQTKQTTNIKMLSTDYA
jgi:hypothetical protein